MTKCKQVMTLLLIVFGVSACDEDAEMRSGDPSGCGSEQLEIRVPGTDGEWASAIGCHCVDRGSGASFLVQCDSGLGCSSCCGGVGGIYYGDLGEGQQSPIPD